MRVEARRRQFELDDTSLESLRSDCRRSLCKSARRHYRGPRAELRRALRAFLRRFRRDAEALRFVLRAVSASSALALPLLGLTFPAHADFVEKKNQNPLPGPVQCGLPDFGDLDGDGDFDLMCGAVNGTTLAGSRFHYFENVGTRKLAMFAERTGNKNPLNAFDLYSLFRFATYFDRGWNTSFADLDGDGDLDSHLLLNEGSRAMSRWMLTFSQAAVSVDHSTRPFSSKSTVLGKKAFEGLG